MAMIQSNHPHCPKQPFPMRQASPIYGDIKTRGRRTIAMYEQRLREREREGEVRKKMKRDEAAAAVCR